jgi:hypothetical protein
VRNFDYMRYVHDNGHIFVKGLGYVSPQMHAEMVASIEQRKRDDAVILGAMFDQSTRGSEMRA